MNELRTLAATTKVTSFCYVKQRKHIALYHNGSTIQTLNDVHCHAANTTTATTTIIRMTTVKARIPLLFQNIFKGRSIFNIITVTKYDGYTILNINFMMHAQLNRSRSLI